MHIDSQLELNIDTGGGGGDVKARRNLVVISVQCTFSSFLFKSEEITVFDLS